METLFADVRYAFRMMARSPGWAAAVVLSFALGAGANMAIFSLTYAVVLKSLPVPNPSQLILYTFRNGEQDIGLSGPLFQALRKQQGVATDLFAWSGGDFELRHDSGAEQVHGALISGNGFNVLEVHPFLGTEFGEQDDQAGGGPGGFEAMLGYDYWKTHLHGDRSLVGQVLTIDGKRATVIGILPQGFENLITGFGGVDVLLPLSFEADRMRVPGSFWLTVMGRLKAGQSIASARANLAAIQTTVRAAGDPSHRFLDGFFSQFKLGVETGRGGRSFLRMTYEKPLIALELLSGALLLLCCANTTLLIFSRISGRIREFALRGALGAGRPRLLRQVLVEVLLLATAGLIAAIGLGLALARSLVKMLIAPSGGSPDVDVTPNLIVLGAVVGLTFLAALIAGLWPAMRASRVDPGSYLKQREQSGVSGGAGGWIVQVQVAASVILVAGSLMLGNSFLHLLATDSGFRPDHVVFADVKLSTAKLTDAQMTQVLHNAVEHLENTAGISSAAALPFAPFIGWSGSDYYSVGTGGELRKDSNVWGQSASPGYFSTMGTRILEGRGIEKSDLDAPQVCVISASAAQYFFPGEDPVGRTLHHGSPSDGKANGQDNACRIVGLAEDARYKSLREAAPRMIYLPITTYSPPQFTLAVRASVETQAVDALREAVRLAAPSAAAPSIYSFSALVDWHLSRERMLIRLSGSFAAIALLLTAVGLFGLMMRGVTQRTQEIGVRVALGASPAQVGRAIFARTARQLLIGLIIGTIAAEYATQSLNALLSGVSPNSVSIYVGTAAVILCVGLISAAIPLRRALAVDPMEALRSD